MREFEIEKYLTVITSSFVNYLTKELLVNNISMGRNQAFTFIVIIQNEGIKQESIGRLTRLDKISISRAIKKLNEDGLVITKKDEKDKRFHKIYVTEEGQQIAIKVKQIVRNFISQMFGTLQSNEIINLNEQIEDLASNIMKVKDL